LSHLNYGNFTMPQQIPMSAYIMTDLAERIPEQLGKLNILDKMRDEALWGADYLTRILDPEGYFYTNIFDNWTGLLNQREICAFEGSKDTLNLTWYPDFRVGTKTQDWQAAFREGAGVAIATLARISQWEQSGDSSSTAYLAAATKAWDHLASNNFANARAYADDKKLNIIDDITILLAATELWKATQKTTYLDEAETRVLALNERLHSEGYFIADDSDRPFYHAADAGLPIAALSRFLDVHPKSIYSILVKATIAQHLNYLIKVTKEIKNPYGYPRQHIKVDTIQTSFFIPQVNETGYWWQGENARLGSLAFAAIAGGRHLKGDTLTTLGVQPKYHDYAMTQLNWIMGQNPYDICFMAGIGYNNPLLYGDSTLYHGGLEGGISNGITSYQFDGGYITWNPSGSNEKWRWVRQWLPNAHWYMAAVGLTSQLSEAVNHPSTPTITESFALNFNVRVGSSHIELDWAKPNKSNAWKIYDLQGGLLAHGTTNDAQVSIPWNQKGIFLVQSNKKLRKFVYK
ncbi:MAG: hypothetical protein GX801_10335, partial [Fibrobacter sp.]|nr:hypothetical protein [Fibrobacter sp.]